MVEQAQRASSLLLAIRLPLVVLARHLGNSERLRLGIRNSLCEHKGSAEIPHGRFLGTCKERRGFQGRGQHKQELCSCSGSKALREWSVPGEEALTAAQRGECRGLDQQGSSREGGVRIICLESGVEEGTGVVEGQAGVGPQG